MKKARVKVTNICGRKCDGCCNNDPIFRPTEITSLKQVLDYDEILITGGDPALYPQKMYNMLERLIKLYNYKGKVYLYTSSVMSNSHLSDIIWLIDGFQHTVHYEANDFDIMELSRLSNFLVEYNSKRHSFRLAIDKRLYERYDFGNIDLSGWSIIRKLVWQEHCPLPKGEELFYFDMVKYF